MTASNPVRANPWFYMGGDVVTSGGASVEVVTMPDTATIIEIAANAEDVYFTLNGAAASANSPGFVVAGGKEIIGPLSNLARLDVFQAAGGTAHLMWFKEQGF